MKRDVSAGPTKHKLAVIYNEFGSLLWLANFQASYGKLQYFMMDYNL